MSTGYILILAVLLLGGVIATVGDRLGSRVGKARLSLFNLRPRKTATLVTILTGTVIAASTLGILFATSEYLRTGIFELDSLQRTLRRIRGDLHNAQAQKNQAEAELARAQAGRASAQKQLADSQQQLAEADRAVRTAIAERSRAQAETARAEAELIRTQSQLRAEINQLEVEKNQLIAQKEGEVKEKERQVQKLEAQQTFLAREIQELELERQGLRQGNVAVQRGQVLASALVRVPSTIAAKQVVDQLLNEANRTAIRLARPGTNGQIIQITNPEVEQLINRINDGKDYVVRIFSAANYLIGETPIQVFADAVPNRSIFLAGDVVAATSIDPSRMTDEQIQQRINLLIAAANFRARSLGILTDSVEIGRIQDLITFITQLKQHNQMVELKAVASEVTYVAGPLKVELIAVRDGQVLFRTTTPSTGTVN
ncbi:DUF3084 domain-containing protein [Leptothermofonsia sichuanensis E412]|uniref:DUF3084 domain-containing protein n=1 Tax=Leptothermofonsia sichuanensis TaxID=2917832 RepID=UPI001CA753F0|nr:DUF3084 domain-containing protein [Leptothermofonsia sichuanensis]QZZ22780.1 DUF3084 domain-containing protein [Leptothermofonsia sichuanensis E412]